MANQDYTSTRTPPFVPQDSNIFRDLRFGNIFGPEEVSAEVAPSGTPANDKLNELLANYPETQAPGVMKKIVLSMIGMNDPRLSAELGNQPSGEQQDWLDEIEFAQAAAEMERQMAGQDIQRAGQEISRERLALDQYKAQHPDMDLVKIEGGNYGAYDPAKGEITDLGIPTGTLTEQEEIELRVKGQKDVVAARLASSLKVAGVKGKQASALATQKSGQATALATHKGEQTRETAERREELLRGRPDTDRRRSQSDIRTGIVNRAQRLINDRPELAEWITIEGNQVTVSPEGREIPWNWDTKGPTPEERKEIIDIIYPEESGQGLVPESEPPTNPSVGDTYTWPNGRIGTWDGTKWVGEQ